MLATNRDEYEKVLRMHSSIRSEQDWSVVFNDENHYLKLYKHEIVFDIMAHRKNTIFLLKGHNIKSFLPRDISSNQLIEIEDAGEESMKEKRIAFSKDAAPAELWSVKNSSIS